MKLRTLIAPLMLATAAHAQLPKDDIPSIEVLPARYPDTWIYAHDAAFYSLVAGKIIIVDAAADTREYKGAIGAAQFATFNESTVRGELYVSETFYSRGVRGDRSDVVSVYAKDSLARIAEIPLPGSKRALMVTKRYASRLIDNDRFLVVFNFNPSASATVVDLERRTVVATVELPGCSLLYPTGERGFTSLCGDGSTLTVHLDDSGRERARFIGAPFFKAHQDPVFDYPAIVDGIAYFVSYAGSVYPLDLRGETPEALDSWSLLDNADRQAGWAPSGWQVIASDGEDRLFVIMRSESFDGSHKSGGDAIWVASMSQKKTLARLLPKANALSLAYVASDTPLLAVTNSEMQLDVYTPEGKLLRTISLGDTAMPFALHEPR
jgi:methylamine dehydrogenase heavy chain